MIPGVGRSPGEGNGNPLQYSCLENPDGQRSLAGCKELDTTEQLTQTALCFCCLQAAYLLYKDVFMYFLNLVTAFMFKNVKDL